jgi:hypothetical protein
MPYRDPQKHRDYYREYMRRRAALKKAAKAAPQPKAAKAAPQPEAKPASSPQPDSGLVDRLQARIRELEAELAGLKSEPKAKPASSPQPDSDLLAKLKEVEAELARYQKVYPPPLPEKLEEWEAARRKAQAQAKAKREKEDAKREAAKAAAANMTPEEERTVLEKLAQAEKLLQARNTQIGNLKRRLSYYTDTKPPRMSKRLHRQVLGWLHPDRAHNDEAMRRKLEKCFQQFSTIEFKFPPEDQQ